ncbi:hypothetical protein LWI29_015158 [Acer saccharum]|uniref:Uncharacterized protein n=1 Tax=Acer saccharum TaxID=4024 RepID=A0AA39VDJ6_ACESA|nr:hypothetical protein LWI29_015158 [Acer saccharum]
MENLGKSFHVMECRVMECHGTVMECNGMSCHGMSWYGHGMSCNLRIWEDHGISFHVMENQGKSFHVMECRVMECNVMVRSWNIFVEAKLTPTEAEKGLWYYQGIAEVCNIYPDKASAATMLGAGDLLASAEHVGELREANIGT